jgi:hypothetical protein
LYISVFLLALSPILVNTASACEMEDTVLFVELDVHWKYNESEDKFVARTDVTNIGDYTAYCICVELKDIPEDWVVIPNKHFTCKLGPGNTSVNYFIITRGENSESIYAEACAFNADPVQSETIPIPIFHGVLALLGVVCGVIVHRDIKKRKIK